MLIVCLSTLEQYLGHARTRTSTFSSAGCSIGKSSTYLWHFIQASFSGRKMENPPLHLRIPPALHPSWLQHASQLPPVPVPPDVFTHKANYLVNCRAINARLLSTRDIHLTQNIRITDVTFTISGREHVYREYTPEHDSTSIHDAKKPAIVYYHGGGLFVGDLDSEDLTCRRICIELGLTVFSCSYRLMPEYRSDDSLSDALDLFWHLSAEKKGPFVLVGSSSGGQLAAQVSQAWLRQGRVESKDALEQGSKAPRQEIVGVLLRCPVTCNATSAGEFLPSRYKSLHASLSDPFTNSLGMKTCVDSTNRTTAKLPLEEDNLTGMPRHWVQLCSNDIFYSDGACYVDALVESGGRVRTDVLEGWPHTFWLKAPDCKCSPILKGVDHIKTMLQSRDFVSNKSLTNLLCIQWTELSRQKLI